MRVIAEVPHSRYKIQIFSYNGKYLIKIELDKYEQIFKINEADVAGLEEVKKMITPELLTNCLNRFLTMRIDWEQAFTQRDQL